MNTTARQALATARTGAPVVRMDFVVGLQERQFARAELVRTAEEAGIPVTYVEVANVMPTELMLFPSAQPSPASSLNRAARRAAARRR